MNDNLQNYLDGAIKNKGSYKKGYNEEKKESEDGPLDGHALFKKLNAAKYDDEKLSELIKSVNDTELEFLKAFQKKVKQKIKDLRG